jgi:hypothetical protein
VYEFFHRNGQKNDDNASTPLTVLLWSLLKNINQRESISSFHNESHPKDQGCSESLEGQEEGEQVQVIPWSGQKVEKITVAVK